MADEPGTEPTPSEPAVGVTPEPPAPAPEAPAGGPDESQKAARLERERDSWKVKFETLAATVKGDGSAEGDKKPTVEELQAAAQKAVDDAKVEMATQAKVFGVQLALTKAGCKDTDAAMVHIALDDVKVREDGKLAGLDVVEFGKTYPYLFGQPGTMSTGAPNGGTAPTKPALTIKEGLAAQLGKKR